MTNKPKEFVHITDEAWSKACAAVPKSVLDETPNIIQWAAEAIQNYESDARSQAFEECAKIAEKFGGGGDPCSDFHDGFDCASRNISQAIRQHSQKGEGK